MSKKGHSWCTFFVVNVYTIEILVLYVYYFRFRHILSWMDLFQLEIIRLRRKKFIIHCSKVLYLSSHKWCCWNQFTVHTRKRCINFIILCRDCPNFEKLHRHLAFLIAIKYRKFFKLQFLIWSRYFWHRWFITRCYITKRLNYLKLLCNF